MLPYAAGESSTFWSPVGRASDWATEAGFVSEIFDWQNSSRIQELA